MTALAEHDTYNPFGIKFMDWRRESARHGGMVETGVNIFESEDLTDSLLQIYLSMMSDGWASRTADSFKDMDIFHVYARGLWLPCTSRFAFEGQIDVRNDGIPEFGAVPIVAGLNKWNFASAYRKPDRPKGWAVLGNASAYYLMSLIESEGRFDGPVPLKPFDGKRPLAFDCWYYALIGDNITPMKKPYGSGFPNGGPAAGLARYGSAALQAVSDFKHLWVVETEESVIGSDLRTPIRLGVTPAMVGSLFYARNLPVAESGRRRPILHWVRAHQRRMQAGTRIDVLKHLRGIISFEMDGFGFRITQPIKRVTGARS